MDRVAVLAVLMVAVAAMSARVIQQYEKGLVFRFGRLRDGVRGPGLTMIAPVMDLMRKVNMQITTMPVESTSTGSRLKTWHCRRP